MRALKVLVLTAPSPEAYQPPPKRRRRQRPM